VTGVIAQPSESITPTQKPNQWGTATNAQNAQWNANGIVNAGNTATPPIAPVTPIAPVIPTLVVVPGR
jgi:hypothetical protein